MSNGEALPGRRRSASTSPVPVLAVVDERAHRGEPERLLERRLRALLVRIRGHQRGVQVHDHLTPIRATRPAGQRPTPGPHRRPSPGVRRSDRRQRHLDIGGQPGDQTRHRRIRGNRPEHLRLGPDHRHIGQTVTPQRDHSRDIGENLAGSRIARRPRHGANAADSIRSIPETRIVCRSNSPPADEINDSRAGSRTTPATTLRFTYGVPSRSADL